MNENGKNPSYDCVKDREKDVKYENGRKDEIFSKIEVKLYVRLNSEEQIG